MCVPDYGGQGMTTIAILGIFLVLALGAGFYVSGKVPGTANWVLGGLAAFLGVVGLFVAARGGVHSPVAEYGGVVFFILAMALVLYLVKQGLDEIERHRRQG
jgi:hypothetical protein